MVYAMKKITRKWVEYSQKMHWINLTLGRILQYKFNY